ncbi:hypothetical protein ASE30_07100 [Achromobacter sp. Root83]|uniref:hypothetical protein n=1 Tax=Achromobacter sp. Root83 TaxID=1736602 RepID=UPI00070B0184|nr:hypothetical protein [Achromobacter sp. Root83]KRC76368.1 hypothetical protein ASE30_07100 [Achromobacter sp. Root83]
MNAPQILDDLDDVDLAALSTRVLHNMVAKMTPEERQRYRDALDAADTPSAISWASPWVCLIRRPPPRKEMRNLSRRIFRHALGHFVPVMLERKSLEGIWPMRFAQLPRVAKRKRLSIF